MLYTRRGENGAGVIEALRRGDLTRRVVCRLPGAQLGECSVSADGEWVVTAIKRGDRNGIAVAATSGTDEPVVVEFPRTVIHPQFHPVDSDWIELAADPAPRMYRVGRDGSGLECLYQHGNDEFVVHETFLGAVGDLVFTVWPRALRRLSWESGAISTIVELNAWHISPNRAGTRIVCDTNHPESRPARHRRGDRQHARDLPSRQLQRRYAVAYVALRAAEDFARAARSGQEGATVKRALSWMETPTDTVYGPQWSHPHPPSVRRSATSATPPTPSGFPQVYLAEL